MNVNGKKLFLHSLFLLISVFTFANETPETHSNSEGKETKESVNEYMQHHLKDAHSIEFFEKEGTTYGFPLPVILFDKGMHIFSSARFCNPLSTTEVAGNYYTLFHEKIYKTDANGTLHLDAEHHPTNAQPVDLSITKNVFYIMFVVVLMCLAFIGMARSYSKNGFIPKGLGRFLEPIVIYVKEEIAIPNIGEKKYKRYLPFLLTIFFFIWILNLLGITPLGVNITGNVIVTLVLALFTFFITNFTGTKTYWMHMLDPLGNSMPWFGKVFLYPILVPIELIGIIIRPFSLFIRLFANMTAGHLVIMSLVAMMFFMKNWLGEGLTFLLSFVIMIIEFFVAALQAYIFTMLSAMYFGMASAEPSDDH